MARAARTADREPTIVRGQRWPDLDVPQLGTWTPTQSVCVVLPARDCQDELDRTLASLAQQTYPSDLTEVVVVDDASTVPLRLPRDRPAHTRLLTLEDAPGHGSGRARHAGASVTEAEVVLFIDADMVVDRWHVEAHARWHHVTPHAVVLAHKWFVDFAGITPAQVSAATAAGDIEGMVTGRRRRRHEWHEEFVAAQDELTRERTDAFLAVVGASVSIRADLYERSGGFASFGLRGIVDTEFGYRAFTAGALLVPDREAVAYHQGVRNFARSGATEIKRMRTGLAANHLPIDLFRPANTGRQWAVPMMHVVVDVGGASPEEVQVTTDSVLASNFTDLVVTVTTEHSAPLPTWVSDYFSHESRVSFTTSVVKSGFPSPMSAAIPAGLMVDVDTLRRAIDLVRENQIGILRTNPDDLEGRSLEVWSTRAVLRSTHPEVDDVYGRAAELFGERWVPSERLGVRPVAFEVTKQGMLALQ